MASIRREVVVAVPIDDVWDAVRDFGALHERLAAGFATDTRLEGDDRIVTFFTGTVVRERLISLDDDQRRLVWTIVDGPWTHHNGSVELHAEDDSRTRFVWTTDILPHETAQATVPMVEQGIEAIRKTLEEARSPTSSHTVR
jgi:Polyketide cyclase / dehydrase and lipid transport